MRVRAGGFTLAELLVSIAIVAILASILATTLSAVRSATRGFMCKNKLLTVVRRFTLFADEYSQPYRGEQSGQLPGNRFYLEDFQQSIYGIGEFLPHGLHSGNSMDPETIDYQPDDQPLICPAGPQRLSRRTQLSAEEVYPLRNVSVGMNMRLHKAPVYEKNRWILQTVTLSARTLDRPFAPLVFDLDGYAAHVIRGRPPFFSAPPGDNPDDSYADDAFWFPAKRHNGRTHVGFVGGHVGSSASPLNEPGWEWWYQPSPDD